DLLDERRRQRADTVDEQSRVRRRSDVRLEREDRVREQPRRQLRDLLDESRRQPPDPSHDHSGGRRLAGRAVDLFGRREEEVSKVCSPRSLLVLVAVVAAVAATTAASASPPPDLAPPRPLPPPRPPPVH